MSDEAFTLQVIGNIQNCRTEVEIYFGGLDDPWAVVWEDNSGWQTEVLGPLPVPRALAEKAVAAAQGRLSKYVNRRGGNPPPGLSAPGLSLWLLAKDDGTAMGRPFP